jgi:hypothetical protein
MFAVFVMHIFVLVPIIIFFKLVVSRPCNQFLSSKDSKLQTIEKWDVSPKVANMIVTSQAAGNYLGQTVAIIYKLYGLLVTHDTSVRYIVDEIKFADCLEVSFGVGSPKIKTSSCDHLVNNLK